SRTQLATIGGKDGAALRVALDAELDPEIALADRAQRVGAGSRGLAPIGERVAALGDVAENLLCFLARVAELEPGFEMHPLRAPASAVLHDVAAVAFGRHHQPEAGVLLVPVDDAIAARRRLGFHHERRRQFHTHVSPSGQQWVSTRRAYARKRAAD